MLRARRRSRFLYPTLLMISLLLGGALDGYAAAGGGNPLGPVLPGSELLNNPRDPYIQGQVKLMKQGAEAGSVRVTFEGQCLGERGESITLHFSRPMDLERMTLKESWEGVIQELSALPPQEAIKLSQLNCLANRGQVVGVKISRVVGVETDGVQSFITAEHDAGGVPVIIKASVVLHALVQGSIR